EERHHRRDEVGIGHLPGATVVAAVALLHLLDDDDVVVLGHDDDERWRRETRQPRRQAAAATSPARLPLQTASVSSNDGLTSSGSVRRANSTAIAGGKPL